MSHQPQVTHAKQQANKMEGKTSMPINTLYESKIGIDIYIYLQQKV